MFYNILHCKIAIFSQSSESIYAVTNFNVWVFLIRSFTFMLQKWVLSTLQEGNHHLSYDVWLCLKGSYDRQEKKKNECPPFVRVLGPLDLLVLIPLILCWHRQFCGLYTDTAHTLGCTSLLKSMQVSLCSVVCADNSHPTVEKKC